MKNSSLSDRCRRLGSWLFLATFAAFCLAQEVVQDKVQDKVPEKVEEKVDEKVPEKVNAGIEAPSPAKPPVQDIFAVRTWAPAQVEPVALKEAPPKRPQVPQLPFRFIGKIADPDKSMAFLLGKDGRILSVSVGDVIGGVYLVEKYERAHLYFIYKPMKARQSLFVGSAS